MKNNRTLIISILLVVAVFIGAIVFIPQLTKSSDGSGDGSSTPIDISEYDTTKLIAPSADNGNIGDHYKGDIKNAKVVLYEYADYQCTACAMFSTWIPELLKEYDGKLAIVFRVYPLTSIHSNAIAAASAVEAAGLQGYWEEMGDLVFANQSEWYYSTGTKRTEHFVNYFKTVSNGKGDVDQFKSDMASDAVKAKINFDKALAESLKLDATPSFVDADGNELDFITDVEQTKTGILKYLRSYIDKKLAE